MSAGEENVADVSQVVASFTDATGVREAGEHHKLVAEKAADVVARFAADGTLLWVSPSIQAAFGWDRAGIVGTQVRFAAPASRQEMSETVAQAIAEHAAEFQARLQVLCADGTVRWADSHNTLVWGESGELDSIVVSLRDVDEQVRAQQEADRQSLLRAAALDAMLDPLALLEPVRGVAGAVVDFRYVEVNRAAAGYLGRPAEDLVGMALSEVMSVEGAAAVIPAYAHTLETGEPMALDGRPLSSPIEGTTRLFDLRVTAAGGYVEVTWRDATDRVEAEARLGESEQRYRMVAENASDVVSAGDNDGMLTWVTEGVTDLLGWRPDELVGLPFRELVHPDDRDQVTSVQQHLAEGKPAHLEVRLQTVVGDFRWVGIVVRPVFDDEGTITGRAASWRDIEGERAVREATEDSELQFRTVMDASTIGMCLVAPDGSFLRVNPALCDILGRPREELMTTTWQELTHPEDLSADLELLAEVLRGDRDTYRLAKRYLRPDGQVVWGDLAVACRRGDDGQVEYLISQIVDITELTLARQDAERREERRKALLDSLMDPHVL
ncbi:MAG: hypothetical protein RLZ55_505, partial [Actinomycetota bacterium]